jgi:hypothetical protein
MPLDTSESDSSTSSDDGTEDETIKRRPGISHSEINARKDKGKAKSEMGHKSGVNDYFARDSAPQRANSGHSRQPSKPGPSGSELDFPPRPQSSLGHHTPAPKLQSSVSTTVPSPSATMKLAATRVASTPDRNIGMYYIRSRNLVNTHILFQRVL